MAVIRPFSAVRPPSDKVADVASVPYDVVNVAEARALAADNPLSFLRVSRAEIDFPDGTDPYSDAVYRRALTNYETLIKSCPLETENSPSIYLYRLRMGEQEQIGVVACSSLDEYDRNLIKKHERTRRDKEDDRTRHMLALRAQTGPVFLAYRQRPEIDNLVQREISAGSLFDFTAPDGIRHTVWHVSDTDAFVSAFGHVPALYIADGHHRAASAARARDELRDQSFSHLGGEEYNFFLTVIFPASQLRILPYNRVVRDFNGLSKADFLSALQADFQVTPGSAASPARRGQWSMYLDGEWYELTLKDEGSRPTGAVESLDVSVLQDRLLAPTLGIRDVRTDKRIDFIGGIRGTAELERLVNEGKAVVAFSLFATTIDDLLKVSDAGEIMPPKSTWFEPKLRDGLMIHSI